MEIPISNRCVTVQLVVADDNISNICHYDIVLLTVCGPGSERQSANSNSCVQCQTGYYQPEESNEARCVSCGNGATTIRLGAVAATECSTQIDTFDF